MMQSMRTHFHLMRTVVTFVLLIGAAFANAAALPYDEASDARTEIVQALSSARSANVPLLVVFGANWCADCRMLDAAFKGGASAELIRQHFRVVKVDVGKFDRNVDVAERYGVPLRKGIPAVAVVSPHGAVIYATKSGELADARRMGERGIFEFFSRVVAERH